MDYIIRLLIVYCMKKVNKYHTFAETLLAQDHSLEYIYSVGVMIHNKNKWMKRMLRLQFVLNM